MRRRNVSGQKQSGYSRDASDQGGVESNYLRQPVTSYTYRCDHDDTEDREGELL